MRDSAASNAIADTIAQEWVTYNAIARASLAGD